MNLKLLLFVVLKLTFPPPGEFFNQFENNLGVVRKAAFQMGRDMGRVLKDRYDIQRDDLGAVAEILSAAMRTERGEYSIEVEEGKVTMCNTGFCSVLHAAQALDLDWEWLDTNFAWPWLEGIVSLVRPDIKLNALTARCRGDEACIHSFEIE